MMDPVAAAKQRTLETYIKKLDRIVLWRSSTWEHVVDSNGTKRSKFVIEATSLP